MPLCTYFVNGNCRFGTKCANDHIDLKNLLKTEAEAVLIGKQWPLSCFGPFKESCVIPNFIADQSFEEVRLSFFEHSKNGNLQSYINNLMNEYKNAHHKLSDLKMPSNEMIQVVANIYNNSTDQKTPTSNVFGSSAGSQQQSMMSTSSIFGTSASSNPFQKVNTQPTSSIFGNSAPATQSTNSIFGSNAATVQPSNSIFGSNAATAQPTGSIFSNVASAQPTGSIFSNNAAPTQPGGSIFGSNAPTSTPFSYASNQPSMQQQNSSVFGQNTTFGAPQPQSNLFAQPASFAAAAIPPGNSIFGATAVQPIQNQPNQSIFGATMQQSAPNQMQTFSQPAASMLTSQPQPQPQQNIFQQQNPNVFSQFQAPLTGGQNQQPNMPSSNIFNSTQIMEQKVGESPFQIQQNPPSAFGSNPFQAAVPFNTDHFYSKHEDLNAQDISEFQADNFTLGKIPLLPPSKSLIN